MKVSHHPDESTLFSYGAGSLPDSLSMVVACHNEVCYRCRTKSAQAEQIGVKLMEQEPTVAMSEEARDEMLAMLENCSEAPVGESMLVGEGGAEGGVPAPLRPLIGEWFFCIQWRTMAPGIKYFSLPASHGKLRLIMIAPGYSIPRHGHKGSELVMVLKGGYHDALGRFYSGDVSDLDSTVIHQPVADNYRGVICLMATDGPLLFKGVFARLLGMWLNR